MPNGSVIPYTDGEGEGKEVPNGSVIPYTDGHKLFRRGMCKGFKLGT